MDTLEKNASLPANVATTHSSTGERTKSVAILLCTYNGQDYLQEQLDSFIHQTHDNWSLYVSDDGSTDNTLLILKQYQTLLGAHRLKIYEGPRKGFGRNFLSLIKNPDLQGDFYTFSDQDDIWHSDKLSRAVTALSPSTEIQPALYCSRTRLVDSTGVPTGFSPLFRKTPGFRNALVQSLAGANTMMINTAALNILRRTPDDAEVVAHDWLAYLLISACGGKVIYDAQPTLDYRQHQNNVIGSNSGARQRLIRIWKMFGGRLKKWSTLNLIILDNSGLPFTTENRLTLDCFIAGRQSGFFKRLTLMKKANLYRQTILGQISLMVAILINKI
jgi:glycosyltransferase involved in cell wall biosynthesis